MSPLHRYSPHENKKYLQNTQRKMLHEAKCLKMQKVFLSVRQSEISVTPRETQRDRTTTVAPVVQTFMKYFYVQASFYMM